MSNNKIEINLPTDLLESIKKGECVLFLASGLSSKVVRSNGKKLPGWKDFLVELLNWCRQNRISFNSEPIEIEEMINKGNFLMAAQELQEIVSPNEFSDFLNQIFRDTQVKPTKNHINLTKIPFRAILTTNYDTLIEGAYAITNDCRLPNKYTQNDLSAALSPLRKKDFFIFKMHGDIDRTETIVLGSKNYSNLLYKSPEYLSFLEILFTTQTVLFIGFGGNDPDLDYVIDRLSTVFSKTLNKHFLLASSNKYNFTEKRRFLIDKRLEIIEYDSSNNHQGLDSFIENIAGYFTKENSQIQTNIKKKIAIVSTMEDFNLYTKYIEQSIQKNNKLEIFGWANFSFYFDFDVKIEPEHNIFHQSENKIDIVLLLVTENSINTKYFEKDIELILLKELENKFKVLPIILGKIPIPYKLKNKLYVHFENGLNSSELKQLQEIIINFA